MSQSLAAGSGPEAAPAGLRAYSRLIRGAAAALVVASLAVFSLAGCAIVSSPEVGPASPPPQADREPVPVAGQPLAGVPQPWGRLAGSLVRQGLPADRVRGFFGSPGLAFTPAPMETKLRELFGILFRSDLTKLVQERLYQLGYSVAIDGRNGSGTKRAIQAFQREMGLQADGMVTDGLAGQLEAALRTGRKRTLDGYAPPQARAPDRSTTHGQFTNAGAVQKIRALYQADRDIFDRMERAYRVPGPLVASIMWIETGYGSYFGKARAAASLASMAASADYGLVAQRLADLDRDAETRAFFSETAVKRGAWARDELAALLRFAWANGHDPMEFPGSVYGAVGYGQFMPSNIAKYAVDGDGDQRIDLFQKTDAIFSIGNFLRQHGWSGDMSAEEKRRAVIRKYNNSGVYVNTVLYVMDAI
jgi:membrane-bound lytic murein transglycosylase B